MEVGAYVAYDINLWADGEKIQPQVPVTVTFENTGLESYDADETTGFQVDETSEQITTIEKISQTEEKVEMTVEHFTITGAWATEQSTPVTLESGTEDFESIAEKYWPLSTTTNQWQIVEELYNKANGHADSEYTLTSDGMFRLQKKAIPTGTENEFYIYLNMEPVMSWEDVFRESTIWLINNNWNGAVDGEVIDVDSTDPDAVRDVVGSHVGKLVDIDINDQEPGVTIDQNGGGKEFIVDLIRLEKGDGTYEDVAVKMHFSLPNMTKKSSTLLYKSPASEDLIKLSFTYDDTQKMIVLPEDAWGQMVSGSQTGDLSLLSGNATPDSVVDQMGQYIEYLGDAKTTNGQVTYDKDKKILMWEDFTELGESDDENDYVVYENNYYRKNAYQLVYKIRLDVTAEGFKSCAGELFAGKMDDEDVHHQTNAKTELNYLVEMDDVKEEDAEFISPEVRGLLYDIEFQKVDETENLLSGAKFKLTGENEISVEATSGEDGFVKFRNLPCGTYQLEEEEAPSGYIKSYMGESVVLCYTTNRENLEQDHDGEHECDKDSDSRNALYVKIGDNGKIVNESEGIDPGPDPSNPSEIPYSKQIDWLGDDDENPDTNLSGDYFYRLYLDATGIPDTEPDAADIIFILDMSNSMNFNMDHTGGDLWDDDKTNDDVEEGTRRLDYVKSSAITAIESIQNTAEKQGADINIGIVTFNYGNGKHYHDHHNLESDDYIGYGQYDKEEKKYYGYHNGTKTLSALTDDYDGLIDQINGLDTKDLDGRTNYQAAFEQADKLLNDSTSEKKYVVFITDGETNGYTSDQNVEEFVEITNNQKAITEANSVAKAWENKLDGFYTIAVSTDILKDKLSGVGPSKVARLNLQANDEDAIEDAFNTVVSAITKQVCDVTITDQLSDYVEFVNESGQTFSEQNISDPTAENIGLKVTKMSEDGEVQELDSDSYTVEIDAETKQISVNFGEDYFLEPKATYTISFNVKLTDKAFEDSMSVRGDEGTDYGNNNTSSEKPGHYSNMKATVTYSTVTDGKLIEYEKEYKRPVVQVQGRTEWELFKKSDTQTSNLYLAGAVFELWKDGQRKYTGISIEDKQETTNVDEQGYVQWKTSDGTEIQEIQEKDMEVGTYTLKEVQAPVGYSLSNTTWRVTIKYMEAPEIVPISSDGTEGTALDCIVEGNHAKYVFVITNTALYDLPSAGGSGIFWYLISGTAFMMAASLILYRMKRKEVLGK